MLRALCRSEVLAKERIEREGRERGGCSSAAAPPTLVCQDDDDDDGAARMYVSRAGAGGKSKCKGGCLIPWEGGEREGGEGKGREGKKNARKGFLKG